eukprot:gene22233-28348_t
MPLVALKQATGKVMKVASASPDTGQQVPAISVLSLTMTSWAQAQTIEINPVVISATRVEQKLSNVIPSATVITRAEIERAQAPTLVDLLQGQPGIEIGRNGGPGTYSSIFMRGQNSNNVAVYIDGVRVQTDSIGALRLVDMPPNQIEKVEILRGNMGAVYGDSAVGGVINIFTRAGAGSFGPTASVSYGSRNTSDVGLGYNTKGEDFRLGYSGLYEKLDYQINLRHDQVKSKSTSTSIDKSANTWLLGLGYLLTEKFKLTGLVSTSFRAPNTAELFDVPAWGTTGNLNLKPEEHKGLELGASYATELGTLRLVRFESKTTNAIAYKSGTPSYENIGLVENKGYETGFSGVSNGWVYKLSAVHQDPINAQTGARLARRAREYGSIYVGKTLLGIDWGTQIVASAKKMTPEWTGRIKIENAFDQKYQLAYGYDTPPRGVFVSMQYQP